MRTKQITKQKTKVESITGPLAIAASRVMRTSFCLTYAVLEHTKLCLAGFFVVSVGGW